MKKRKKWTLRRLHRVKSIQKMILTIELIALYLIGTPAYAATFTPPQAVLDGIQWLVLASQFGTVAFAAWQLGPIGWSFMRKNQQKVEEGKEHAMHVAIGIAIVFVGLWVLKTYIETLGGTYPLSF